MKKEKENDWTGEKIIEIQDKGRKIVKVWLKNHFQLKVALNKSRNFCL